MIDEDILTTSDPNDVQVESTTVSEESESTSQINNKFIYFLTYDAFNEQLQAGNINRGSIVFVEDRCFIWTHDKEYCCMDKSSSSSEDWTTSVGSNVEFKKAVTFEDLTQVDGATALNAHYTRTTTEQTWISEQQSYYYYSTSGVLLKKGLVVKASSPEVEYKDVAILTGVTPITGHVDFGYDTMTIDGVEYSLTSPFDVYPGRTVTFTGIEGQSQAIRGLAKIVNSHNAVLADSDTWTNDGSFEENVCIAMPSSLGSDLSAGADYEISGNITVLVQLSDQLIYNVTQDVNALFAILVPDGTSQGLGQQIIIDVYDTVESLQQDLEKVKNTYSQILETSDGRIFTIPARIADVRDRDTSTVLITRASHDGGKTWYTNLQTCIQNHSTLAFLKKSISEINQIPQGSTFESVIACLFKNN